MNPQSNKTLQKAAGLSPRIIFLLSLAGLAVCIFLAYEYSLPGSITCPIAGNGCDTVRNSIYSTFLNISIPLWGIAFYLVTATLSLWLIEKTGQLIASKLLFITALSGFIFSAYLTYLEAFVILAYCFWCVISAIIATIIFVAASINFLYAKRD